MGNLGEVTSSHGLISNVVRKKAFRDVQLQTIIQIAEYLIKSAGPNGSNTCITKYCNTTDPSDPNAIIANTVYSKDGKTILENIKFLDSIENAIVDELRTIAAHLVSVVGDGTTSVIMLSSIIFASFVEKEDKLNKKPFQIIRDFKAVAEEVKSLISEASRETTLEDIYKIALISTNGNEEIAKLIRDTYEQCGLNTHISIGYSNSENTIIKSYEGLTINSGYLSSKFINNPEKFTCELRKPRVYAFESAVINVEMMSLFNKIIEDNVFIPAQEGRQEDIIPTVILCNTLSVDLTPVVRNLEMIMSKCDANNAHHAKPPVLIITDISMDDTFGDLVTLLGCGDKLIRNYINPSELKKQQDVGLAPTIDNISTEWYGTCDEVIASASDTRFINPDLMHIKDEQGEYVVDENDNYKLSSVFNGLITEIKSTLNSMIKENAKESKIIEMRKRLNSLETNMVELLIGGISTTDIEATKHLAEDAVLNCRSAIKDGCGYGANFEGLRAVRLLKTKIEPNSDKMYIIDILDAAYTSLLKQLYETCMSTEEAETEVETSIYRDMPINLVSMEYDGNVLSSIMTDQCILDSIAKIISVMFTANQAIVSDPRYNCYER